MRDSPKPIIDRPKSATTQSSARPARSNGGRWASSSDITTAPAAFHAVQDALKAHTLEIDSAELTMVPKNTVKVEGADAERILKLMEVLEELDDVSKVSSNFDIDAAQLAEAEA